MMKQTFMLARAVAGVGIFVLLSSCMMGPDYQRPDVPMANQWHVDLKYKSVAEPTLADIAWIDLFKDEKLRSFIQQALETNKGLLIAIERIEEARAVNRISRAALFPTLDLALTGERENESALTTSNPERVNEFYFGPTLTWELDLWGKNRRYSNAAYADYLASEYGAQAVRLSLIAEVCRAYFQLQGVDQRLAVSYDTLSSREQALVIAQKRFKGGLTSKLEVKQAEVELGTSRSLIPRGEQDKLIAENQLSILMGQPPQHLNLNSSLEEQFLPVTVTAGLPSSLIERRPDIMQAEQRLIRASELVGVSTAKLFPSIAISGDLGYKTAEFGSLLDSDGKYWILEIDILMPLFNSGARRAELTAAESRFNQTRLAYEQTVLEALREVSDSLNQFHKSGESLQAILALEKSAQEYLSLAMKRYRNGVLAHLDVLDAQRLLFDAQISASEAYQSKLFALVDLYKALGGGWEPEAISSES